MNAGDANLTEAYADDPLDVFCNELVDEDCALLDSFDWDVMLETI